jgi:hypothetical protein
MLFPLSAYTPLPTLHSESESCTRTLMEKIHYFIQLAMRSLAKL